MVIPTSAGVDETLTTVATVRPPIHHSPVTVFTLRDQTSLPEPRIPASPPVSTAARNNAGLLLHAVPDADAGTAWLLDELRALTIGPFDKPVILASHAALQRALTLGVARALGCAASMRFVSPAGWVDEIAGLEGRDREWRPTAMAWRLTAVMRDQVNALPQSAQHYVNDGDAVGLLDFARAVAQRFRAYLLYRPALLLAWEEGKYAHGGNADEQWQCALWRALVAATGTRSPAQICADLHHGRFRCPESVPEVVLMVAGATLPPTTRAVLEAISAERVVKWCVVSPASANGTTTLLRGVQSLIAGQPSVPRPLDDTLTFHACHSPLREIETLRERLVAALEADQTLRPHDVTLYVTSLDQYLPAIDAVFGVDEPGLPRLPYEVAGRPYRDRSPLVAAFLQLLEASDGRATLEEIGGLLRSPPIAAAAGFSEDESGAVTSWATRAAIVWGADAADREERFGLPPLETGTWRRGIDRLVLGVAMGRTDSPVGDVLPVSGEMAGQAELIGRFSEWTEALFATFTELREERSATEWRALLERVAAKLLRAHGGDDFDALRTLRAAWTSALEEVEQISGDAPVRLSAIRSLIEHELEERTGGLGHLRGGMRVCTLEAGTVLPARVVLIAGVDDSLHPASGGSLAWDLLHVAPEPGDPDRRADSLAAFREAISTARARAHLAWTGFTMAKHEPRAPSVAVSALRDLAEQLTGSDARLVTEEPAHPFSARMFSADDDRLASAATRWAQAAALIGTRGGSHVPFAPGALDDPPAAGLPTAGLPAEARLISLDMLAECVKDPTRFYCRRVLQLLVHGEDEELAEREPQALKLPVKVVDGALRKISWRLESAQRAGDKRTLADVCEWIMHQPEMPYGEEGRVLADLVGKRWWPQVERMRSIEWREPVAVQLDVGGGRWTIVGRLDRLTDEARVVESLYKMKSYSAVGHWVPHLVLNAIAERALAGDAFPERALPRTTRVLADEEWSLGPVDDAAGELARLCAFYDDALAAPQPLFRHAACAWLNAIGVLTRAEAGEDARRKAHTAARNAWHGTPTMGFAGEMDSEWNQLCWPDRGFDDDRDQAFVDLFADHAERLLLPFRRACIGLAREG